MLVLRQMWFKDGINHPEMFSKAIGSNMGLQSLHEKQTEAYLKHCLMSMMECFVKSLTGS